MTTALKKKYASLLAALKKTGGVVVAYSGGTDSALLLAAALKALGPLRVIAAVGESETYPPSEKRAALSLARKLGARVEVIKTRELSHPAFRANPPERCFYCKNELFGRFSALARREKMSLADGTTVSDDGDFRPGRKAAAKWKVVSPLKSAGFSKPDVRALSRFLKLPTHDKPAQACLASRFPYGEKITPEKLRLVAIAENFLRREGFRALRVRYSSVGESARAARIELGPDEIVRAARRRKKIAAALGKMGFTYVSLDLEGYRAGSQNLIFRRRT